MADPFRRSYVMGSPSPSAFAITAHATNEVDPIPRAVYVGSAGNLVVRLMDDSADVTFSNLAAGTILAIRPRYIRATSTAGSLLGLL